MQTPEQVALSFTGECEPASLGGNCAVHGSPLGGARTCLHVLHLSERIRARDEAIRADERAQVRYVVFHADWREPPGDVIAVFATEAEARAHIDGPGDGCGWSVVEVPAP